MTNMSGTTDWKCFRWNGGIKLNLWKKRNEKDKFYLLCLQNDQSTGEIKVIGGDDLSTLTGKVKIRP